MTHAEAINLDDQAIRVRAEAYFNDVLVRTKMRRPSQQAAFICPTLHKVMVRLSFAVTDVPENRFTGRPLIDSAVENGLIAFFATQKPATHGARAFFQSAFSRLADLYSTEVSDHDFRWTIHDRVPLGTMLMTKSSRGQKARPQIKFQVDDGQDDPCSFRRTLLEMVADAEDLVLLNTTQSVVINNVR